MRRRTIAAAAALAGALILAPLAGALEVPGVGEVAVPVPDGGTLPAPDALPIPPLPGDGDGDGGGLPGGLPGEGDALPDPGAIPLPTVPGEGESPVPAPPEELDTLLDTLLAAVDDGARQADASVDEVLAEPVEVSVPTPDGGEETVEVPLGDALEALAGRSVIDDGNTGIFGTPEVNGGNLMHAYLDVRLVAGNARPTPGEFFQYDVVESAFSPDTPLVPVVNPLALADVPVEDPGLGALVATHWGGRLSSVQHGPENAPARGTRIAGLSWHTAGSTALGHNVDTAPRPATAADPFPFWTPLVHEGTSALPAESMDFAGFALIIEGTSCSGTFVAVCTTLGILLGDGAATYNGAPLDLRGDVPVVWDEAPAPVGDAMTAVDDAVGQLPVGDVLAEALGVLGEVPEPTVP